MCQQLLDAACHIGSPKRPPMRWLLRKPLLALPYWTLSPCAKADAEVQGARLRKVRAEDSAQHKLRHPARRTADTINSGRVPTSVLICRYLRKRPDANTGGNIRQATMHEQPQQSITIRRTKKQQNGLLRQCKDITQTSLRASQLEQASVLEAISSMCEQLLARRPHA